MIPLDILRELVLETFRNETSNQLGGVIDATTKALQNPGTALTQAKTLSYDDENNINQILWDLITERVLTVGRDPANPKWPWVRLTEFGKLTLRHSTNKFYDPDGYIERLQSVVPDADITVVQYLHEATKCYRQQLFFAASVMCGAAAEKTVLSLLAALARTEKDIRQKEEMSSLLDRPNLPKIFKLIESRINSMISSKSIPYAVHQGALQHLLSLFEMIRVSRNDAVHPNAGRVSREKVFLSIQTFPEALSVQAKLINWLSARMI